MIFARHAAAALLLAALATPALPQGRQPNLPQLLSPRVITAMPAAKPAKIVRYGEGDRQFAELYLPQSNDADARLPVVVLIHGGCWRKDVGGIEMLRPAATAFMEKGYAVWSIGYRRIDEEGGGFPGTYQDVGAAIDALRDAAEEHRLDLGRLVLFGHSAGGHLALWAAGRHKLPESSPLYRENGLKPRGVVTVGAIPSLGKWQPLVDSACGSGTIASLTPATEAEEPTADDLRFAETSPERLLPFGVETVLLHGVFDNIAFPAIGLDFAQDARRAGDRSEVQIAPVAGHFEPIAPNTPAFAQARAAVDRLTGQTAR